MRKTVRGARINGRVCGAAGMLVAMTLALSAGAWCAEAEPADLIVRGGRVYTMNPERPVVEALAVRAGRVVAIGTEAELAQLRGPFTRVLDAQGATIVPGLIDAHGHFLGLGASLRDLDLRGTKSVHEIAALVKKRVETASPDEWILGRGWDQNDWAEPSWPTREALDKVAPRNPVFLTRVDGHAAFANTEALRRAGVTKATGDPAGGRLLRDGAGEPTGVLVDHAMELVSSKIPPPSTAELTERARLASRECARVGLTMVQDAGVDPEVADRYKAWIADRVIQTRLYAMLAGPLAALRPRFAKGPITSPDHRLDVRAIKIVADGALGSRGAALLEPYSDEPGKSGFLTSTPEEIYAKTLAASQAGFQTAIHAIGDRANRLVLDTFERVEREVPTARALRPRIEHAQILSAQDIPRFARLGVIASMQATHCTSDMPWAPARLGPSRIAAGAYVWQKLKKAGARIANGSDFPVEEPDPLYGFYAAVTRKGRDGNPPGGWAPEERMTREEALRSFTLDAAYAAHAEKDLGSLEKGKLADFVLLSQDIMTVPEDGILKTRVLATIIGGELVHDGRSQSASSSTDAGKELHALLKAAWEFRLSEDPLLATSVGDTRFDDRLPRMTLRDLERRSGHARETLQRLRALDRGKLSPADRINFDMFERELIGEVAEREFGGDLIPFTSDSGFHTAFAQLPSRLPLATLRDYENYLSRLKAWPQYVADHIDLMREGILSGVTLPRVILGALNETMSAHVVTEPEKGVFYQPFVSFPVGVRETDRERLRKAARDAIREAVIPAYRSLSEFLRGEYSSKARTSVGASDLPRGREYYAHRIKAFTTLDISAEEVHKTGLREVERIRAEMQGIMRRTAFEGDLAAFLKFLREDPRFYAKTGEELLKEAAFIAKKMDGQLPRFFKTLPRLPYGVEPVPDALAPNYTAGRYDEAPIGGTRAGMYWVNTSNLKNRPLYNLEALTLHEAVPGHHLQIALQQEMGDVPAFRRVALVDAFVEGWALYAERLGLEAGFYKDPYRNFGRLTYEMWRACRLVVDTGLHAFGWPRQKAIDFLAGNTALSLHEVRTEIDRYISWPGQALAYKMGEIKIRELRQKAEKELGTRFDLRAFHDAVLANGAVPLSILEEEVGRWMAGQ